MIKYNNVVDMKIKIISLVVCIFCVFSNTATFASQIYEVIIVDDEGDGHYLSIRDALSHASAGDTIEVYSGTYLENNIIINAEGINLIGIPYEFGNGNDTGKPVIIGNGNSSIFIFNASNITLNGFYFNNAGGSDIIDISIFANRCVISNNNLNNTNSCCIYVKSSNNMIINNSISYSLTRQGICLRDPSQGNIVRDNIISDCDTGILTWGSGNNLIENNIVQNCVSYGMDIGNSDNVVRYNTIKNNTIGIQLMSIRTIVSNNNFINNEKYHATAYNSRLSWLISNRWIGNFWDRGRVLPYPILCQFFIFPWIEFDWNPAKVPNSMS